jgi:predicted DsbA family dithiol-disulfide isomerase
MAWRTPARTHSSTSVLQNVAAMAPVVVMSPIVCRVRIEIWSDVVCPWCYIGKRRFDTALANIAAKGNTEPIEVIYRSYQLDPGAPVTGATPVIDAYAKKFGGRERAEQILSHLTTVAAGDGLTFNMDIAQRANTMTAHRILCWVLTIHGPEIQAGVKEAFLAAYFTDGVNIGDVENLLSICSSLELDVVALRNWLDEHQGTAEVAADIEGAAMRDITAVPTYVINDQFMIPGAQDVELFERVLSKMLNL